MSALVVLLLLLPVVNLRDLRSSTLSWAIFLSGSRIVFDMLNVVILNAVILIDMALF